MSARAQFGPHRLSLVSIRGRLALLLALAFFPAGAIALQSGLTAFEARQEASVENYGVDALRRLNAARDQVRGIMENVRARATSANAVVADDDACAGALTQMAAGLDRSVALAFLDEAGHVRCSNRPDLRGLKMLSPALLARALQTGTVAIDFENAAEPRLGLAARVYGRDGRPRYAAVSFPVRLALERAMTPPDGGGAFAALVDRRGVVLAQTGGAADVLSAREDIYNASGAFALGQGLWAVSTPLSRERALFLVDGFHTPPLIGGDLYGAWWALIGPWLLWAAAVGATWFVVEKYVTRPLLIVENLARAYARGEVREEDEALLRSAPAELASLRRTLAAMAKTLRGREARLAAALQEERALLFEVNHRVKNNLQMVASILSIQARTASDDAEARGLARAQERIQVLALAHGRIYASGEVREIALDELADEIVRSMHASRGVRADHVALMLSLAPVRGNADRAVPFAFVLGECVATLLDQGDKISALHVSLAPSGSDGLDLEIWGSANDGVLGPSPPDQRLLNAFARQLHAVFSEGGANGARAGAIRIVIAPSA